MFITRLLGTSTLNWMAVFAPALMLDGACLLWLLQKYWSNRSTEERIAWEAAETGDSLWFPRFSLVHSGSVQVLSPGACLLDFLGEQSPQSCGRWRLTCGAGSPTRLTQAPARSPLAFLSRSSSCPFVPPSSSRIKSQSSLYRSEAHSMFSLPVCSCVTPFNFRWLRRQPGRS